MKTDVELQRRQGLLDGYSSQVHALETELDLLVSRFTAGARDWAWAGIRMGHVLRKIKATVATHNHWEEWVTNNCRTTSLRTARLYKQMSEVYDAATDQQRDELLQSGSIAAFLRVHDRQTSAAPDQGKVKSWPPYIEALGRVSKFVGFCEKFPVSAWPDEGRAKLREDLRPIVEELGGRFEE